jgi:hypothetical protein
MNISPKFLRLGSICCFITVITTLGIHLYFKDPPDDFEQRILLFRNKTYLVNRCWVIAHCLLVIVSMWAFALIQLKKAPGFTGIGFLFFAVFGIAEITRQMYVLYYLNELREQYSIAADPVVKLGLKQTIASGGLLAAPLFGVFIFSFGLGNLCYGLSLFGEKGFDRLLSLLLIIWSLGNFLALANSFWESAALSAFIEKYSFTYQPLIRLLMAWWLWKKAALIAQRAKGTL